MPSKVKIGGLVYAVHVTDNMCSDYAAEIDYGKMTIKVRPDYDPQKQHRDFLHEILHGMFDNLGHVVHDEKLIDELAGGLFALIVDNPGLFDADA